jgi:16S rRNA (guanine527-N7)-methyltransferase
VKAETELLRNGLAQIFTTTDEARLRGIEKQLEKYIEEIKLFNKAYGLVKATDDRELIVKHILDSLAPLPVILQALNAGDTALSMLSVLDKFSVADVGSGAGLPGIPLAVAMPKAHFTLIERMGRRAGFLRDCAAVLGLGNVEVAETEMEHAAPGAFDLVVFRAFRPLDSAILGGLTRLLRPGGLLAAWKGRRAKIDAEMAALGQALPELVEGNWKALPVKVPFLDEERHVVLYHSLTD